jgi:hypothetical protein
MPMWVRNSCYPSKGFSSFFYFDVASAEFANLLMHIDKKKYKEIHFDSDLYDWISSELDLTQYNRTQIKQVSMSLICGATYTAIMFILKIPEAEAKVVVSKFWNLLSDVYAYLEDMLIKIKLNGSIEFMDDFILNRLVDQFDYDNIFTKRKFWSSFIRDSFMVRFGYLMDKLFDKTNRKLCFAWVDSCLIPIQHKNSYTNILKDIERHCIFPLKIKYQVGKTWGEVINNDNKFKVLIIDN